MFIFSWFLLASFIFSLTVFSYLLTMLRESGCVRENFRQMEIPTSGGLLIILNLIFVLGLSFFLNSIVYLSSLVRLTKWLLPLTALIVGVGFLGFLDDVLGRGLGGGFKGHFSRLKEGELTTGVIKALGTGFLSLYAASVFSRNIGLLVLNTLLLALSVNFFNLLDLRPGRCLKVFTLTSAVVFLFSYHSFYWALWGIFLGFLPVLLYADLREIWMLGDVGSNVLGAVFGFSVVVVFSWPVKLAVLVALLLVQLAAEKYSITEFVAKVTPLRFLDELGRKPG